MAPQSQVSSSSEDRKKALQRAQFFAECHLRGIDYKQAHSAMERADEEHDKWWVQSVAHEPSSSKKRRRDNEEDSKISAKQLLPTESSTFEIKGRLINELLSSTANSAESIPNVLALAAQLMARFATTQRHSMNQNKARLEGLWLTLSKPTFSGCLGRTEDGHWRYELGRLTFERFRPNKLLCSIVHVVNNVSLMQVDRQNSRKVSRRRKYDIVSSFIIEPQQLRDNLKIERPIHGLLTTLGYCEEDPGVRNRLTVSFTGGLLELKDPQDLDVWKEIFQPTLPSKEDLEKSKDLTTLIADKFLLGAESKPMQEDGTIRYVMKTPIGGIHGQSYVDVAYMDHSMRILKGHHGTLFVSVLVPEIDDDADGDANETLIQIG